jgi:hypothetical protein
MEDRLLAVKFGAALAVALMLAPPAARAAEADVVGQRCFLFGMGFSEGAVARVGTATKVCRADSTWGKTMEQAAGCIYESKIYSTGALKAVGDAKDTKLECLSDGTWSPVPVVKKP